MNRLLKNFTIIDFLGYFVPGAGVILMIHGYWFNLTSLFFCFFGKNDFALGAYFIILSYLTGQIISELTKILEDERCAVPIWKLKINNTSICKNYWKQVQQKAQYLHLLDDLPAAESTNYTTVVWRRVYHFVLLHTDCDRMRLFKGFYVMCRTGFGACILSAILTACHLYGYASLACLLSGVIFYRRAYRFSSLWQEECCETFLLQRKQ